MVRSLRGEVRKNVSVYDLRSRLERERKLLDQICESSNRDDFREDFSTFLRKRGAKDHMAKLTNYECIISSQLCMICVEGLSLEEQSRRDRKWKVVYKKRAGEEIFKFYI